jgi:hypothetical protein
MVKRVDIWNRQKLFPNFWENDMLGTHAKSAKSVNGSDTKAVY